MGSAAMVPAERSADGSWADAPHHPALGGHRVTFEAVYEANFDFVWRSVRRLGVDEFGVEDVVQEVFLTAHRRLGEFEGRSSVRTWLFAIVVHFVRHYRRTRQRKDVPMQRSGPLPEPDMIADPRQQGPLEAAEQGDAVRLLDGLLHELDDDKREVFVLAELAQLTTTEIADVLGSNVNTVYSRLRVARQDFERALARHRAREARRAP